MRKDKEDSRKIVGRTKFTFICFLVAFILLTLRLFWIQFFKNEQYSGSVARQHYKTVEKLEERGDILDRNGISITNRNKNPYILVHKSLLNVNKAIDIISDNVDMEKGEVMELFESSKSIVKLPLKENYDKKINELEGIYKYEEGPRYNNILCHLVGYINKSDKSGVAGLEKIYNDVLENESKKTISVAVDGKKRIIPGIGFEERNNNKGKNNIKLTIDYEIQKVTEKALGDYGKDGGAIVVDVESGDILAMASRPKFDQNNIGQYFIENGNGKIKKAENGEFQNRVLEYHYHPGSIFKIVVLLSALENNEVSLDEEFYCNGSEEVNGVSFACHLRGGHGKINLEEAFAYSCNSVFIELGKRLGGKKIIETAEKIGFNNKIKIGDFNQVKGMMPKGDRLLGAAVGNISIGQGDVYVTPIQVANMMTIVANNGIEKNLNILDSIVGDNGYKIKDLKKYGEKQVLSSDACTIVKNFMKQVVDIGTANHFDLDGIGGAAGKTGTAEKDDYSDIKHGWFGGYYPKSQPKYAIVVIIENGGSGGHSAGLVFENIVKEIYKLKK
ncbi:peptidoglycan D,D-transpeptidase FtsI family protein [Dethiothermospora halolimnae]|uniref:peptidoglycan D,D-transpeptidase FtsI family protein n=1 Tax=Dethiothermospora halolimnae TaxID=3114390 RepID=UPI003CCBD200